MLCVEKAVESCNSNAIVSATEADVQVDQDLVIGVAFESDDFSTVDNQNPVESSPDPSLVGLHEKFSFFTVCC